MKHRTLLDYLLFGSIWVFLGKVFLALSAFIIAVLVTRLLPPDEAGIYWLASSIAAFLSLTTRFGLDSTLLRLVSENLSLGNYGNASRDVVMGLTTLSIISIGFVVLIYTLYYFYSNETQSNDLWSTTLIGLIVIWSVVLSFQSVVAEIFRAYKEVPFSVIFGGLFSSLIIISIMLLLLTYSNQVTLNTIILATIIAGATNTILSQLVLSRYHLFRRNWRGKFRFSSSLLSQAKAYWINAISHYVLSFSGLWVAGLYLSKSDVAHYGAAMRLTLLISMPLMIVNALVPTLIARLNAKKSTAQLERIVRGMATLATIPSVFVLFLFVTFSSEIFVLAFGKEYVDGADVFNILVFSQVASVLSGSCGFLLLMTGHQKIMMYITLFSAVICTLISGLIARYYGAVGIAFVVTTVIIIQQFVTVIFAHNKTGVWSHIGIRDTLKFLKLDIKTTQI